MPTWVLEMSRAILFGCGLDQSSVVDKFYIRSIHAALTQSNEEECNMDVDASSVKRNAIDVLDMVSAVISSSGAVPQHKCSPLAINIAIHLPDFWADDRIHQYSKAVFIMATVDVSRLHDRGGNWERKCSTIRC